MTEDDLSELNDLDNRFEGTDATLTDTDASTDTELTPSTDTETTTSEPKPEEADWEPLTLYLLEDQHQKFNKPFFMRLQLDYPDLQDCMKRELQQAAIEVAMENREQVVTRAKELHKEIVEAGGRDDDWEPLTVYLTEDEHQEFNKPFFMRLQLDYPELQDMMKRELQQAAIEVATQHKDKVAQKAEEVHQRF